MKLTNANNDKSGSSIQYTQRPDAEYHSIEEEWERKTESNDNDARHCEVKR